MNCNDEVENPLTNQPATDMDVKLLSLQSFADSFIMVKNIMVVMIYVYERDHGGFF